MHIRRGDAARAPMLSPIMLLSCPMVYCFHPRGSMLVGGRLGITGTELESLTGCAAPVSRVQLVEQVLWAKFDGVLLSEGERVME